MTQRLVWNFEFLQTESPMLPLQAVDKEELRWEARYFWPEDQIITLNTIDPALLNLANYERRLKDDVYYLFKDNNQNIKRRNHALQYKPVVTTTDYATAYGPKVPLETLPNGAIQVPVKKEAFIYKFATTPKIKIELSRIEVQNQVYFCVCIEGRSQPLVEIISQHLLDEAISSDYIRFLKKITPL